MSGRVQGGGLKSSFLVSESLDAWLFERTRGGQSEASGIQDPWDTNQSRAYLDMDSIPPHMEGGGLPPIWSRDLCPRPIGPACITFYRAGSPGAGFEFEPAGMVMGDPRGRYLGGRHR